MVEPVERPVMTPDVFTVATLGELTDHEPPVTLGVSAVTLPTQIVEGPDIVPAEAAALTVIGAVAVDTPHASVTE